MEAFVPWGLRPVIYSTQPHWGAWSMAAALDECVFYYGRLLYQAALEEVWETWAPGLCKLRAPRFDR